jgi:hypothetical protein
MRIGFLFLMKTFRRLGYFIRAHDAPNTSRRRSVQLSPRRNFI